MTRATTPPAARSKSAREVGSALPCARATARSGASTWASGALGTPHELREHRIGDAVLHDHLSRFHFPLSRVVFRDGLIPEPALRDLVPPLPEPALGELHDVALVNERDRAATGT